MKHEKYVKDIKNKRIIKDICINHLKDILM